MNLAEARHQGSLGGSLVQTWGAVPETGAASFYVHDGGYLVRFHGVADFELSADGAGLTCHPALNAQASWEPVYRQQVIPLQRAQQGQPVFHGGAVSCEGHAVAMLGPSGQGKSTLTAACARAGLAFLTDDCLMLDESGGILVLPDVDHVRLRDDSYRALTGAAPEAVDALGHKPRLHGGEYDLRYATAPSRLACMLVLEEAAGDDIALLPLPPADAAMAWCANAFVVDQRDAAVLRRGLARGAVLARAVPAYRLAYPRDYSRLPDVVAAVSACLDTAVAENTA